jgi:TolB-like protein/Tfp pilus assembly protein PilF/predicted Ser/Thr protein kinase
MSIKCPKCHYENPDDTFYCGRCKTPLKPLEEISVTKTLETPPKGLTSGTTFATRYEVIEELGKGGMGRVYKALDKEINEEVAIKLLNPEIASDDTTVGRFRNELKFARKIAHKNICKMYHLAKDADTPYITMEYVKGENLKSYIKRKRTLSEDKALSIAKQVCEGLMEAHRLGVVHRDLKPQNIMVDEKGDVKIMDFGIARSVEAPGVTQTGVMIGTPDYISPEQAEGEVADQRSDIYALGVILYEMVTGSVPFKGDTALSVALKHKSKLAQEPKQLNPDVSDDLNKLILICMEKERELRYQTAAELLVDIQNIEEGIPLGERKLPAKKKRLAKKKRAIKWKSVFLYAGLPLLLVLIIAGAIYLYTTRAATIDSIAVLPLENLTGDVEQEYFVDWITDELTGKLARVGALRVISFASMMRYKGSDKPLQQIAQDLNVDAIVTGTVQQAGENVSIRVQLIDLFPEERSLWEETYDRVVTDVLMMHSEIARTIAQEVRAKLTPEAESILASSRQVNPDAQEAYLRGLYHMNQGTPDGYQKAVEYLHEAVEKDPSDPLAYAGLAAAYIQIAHGPLATKDSLPRAKAAAQRAFRLDDTLAETLNVFGFIAGYYDWEWEMAEKAFQRAIEINPNLAMAHYWYSWQLILFDRMKEAEAEHIRAQELDPLTPLHSAWLGGLYWIWGQYEKALEEIHKALELSPNSWTVLYVLGHIYVDRGMYEEAIEVLQKASARYKNLRFLLGCAYAKSGRRDEALEILSELEKMEPTPFGAFCLAEFNIALGNMDEAFRWLNYERPHCWLAWIRVLPPFRPLRNDPRLHEMLKKMNVLPLE